ncbi:TIGR03279 family radical SAM protein [Anabaena sp. FACHB-1237]|uniref:TIGR03279 family radical SAM protein n=1 Tax=Anabaena sp. FACHB-1237 TaxID=2692769 RepID=UPI0016800969|nr:TIGR03279 family radical SAM protein [Anabaena sp. FACHB-1237]MBD2137640.1 TIGR03279 family radical SAM protein [Anabaena sp. FACHB-1237]
MNNIQPAQITKVLANSIAAEIGFDIGDAIVAINGTKPRDLIDYQFLCADEFLELEVLDSSGKTHYIEIEKDEDEDLGLEFSTALFDGLIQCNNRCPFCFIDQQPPGKRSSLYLKDDDYRLSFLYGSYITLTNLSAKEWERIEQMRLSPLYVSVHATVPEIRIKLLKNNRAGEILSQIKWFQERRLQIHAQVVVCPGINDDQYLETTLRELTSFYDDQLPTVASVAVVPVGLTKFRPVEDQLIPVTREKAKEVISQVKFLIGQFKQKYGSSVVWLADEWFLIAGEELPSEAEYEEYPQIDNGVGSIRLFIKQFTEIAQELLPAKVHQKRKFTWVVGNAVETAFQPLVQQLNNVVNLEVKMAALSSDYWGQKISVTGLITGHDLLLHLSGQDLGDGILLPSVMLKYGELVFLDDLKVEDVARKLNTQIFPVTGVEELINTCVNLSGS